MWFGSPKGTKAEHVPEHVGKKGVFPASKVQDPSWIKRWWDASENGPHDRNIPKSLDLEGAPQQWEDGFSVAADMQK